MTSMSAVSPMAVGGCFKKKKKMHRRHTTQASGYSPWPDRHLGSARPEPLLHNVSVRPEQKCLAFVVSRGRLGRRLLPAPYTGSSPFAQFSARRRNPFSHTARDKRNGLPATSNKGQGGALPVGSGLPRAKVFLSGRQASAAARCPCSPSESADPVLQITGRTSSVGTAGRVTAYAAHHGSTTVSAAPDGRR